MCCPKKSGALSAAAITFVVCIDVDRSDFILETA
jgi:hypothetical protein